MHCKFVMEKVQFSLMFLLQFSGNFQLRLFHPIYGVKRVEKLKVNLNFFILEKCLSISAIVEKCQD